MKKSLIFLMMLVAATTVSAQDLVDRVSQAVGVELPSEYQGKVKEFVRTDKVMVKESAAAFTDQYIQEQMKANWGIDRQNQLLFIWDAIYEQVTKKNFYDGEDGNKQRLADFEEAMDNIEVCGKKYKQDFIAYMQQRSAEAQQRSAEAQQRSAEAIKEIMKQDTIWLINSMTQFYDVYKRNPAIVKQEDISWAKECTRKIISDCNKRNIDYRAILRKELGDEQKVKDLLKFYGIE